MDTGLCFWQPIFIAINLNIARAIQILLHVISILFKFLLAIRFYIILNTNLNIQHNTWPCTLPRTDWFNDKILFFFIEWCNCVKGSESLLQTQIFNSFIFAAWRCNTLIFQTCIIWSTKIHYLKYLNSTILQRYGN